MSCGESGNSTSSGIRQQTCNFSNPVSRRDLLTCDDASCLTRCHRAFVSNSCHFFRTPISIPWRRIQSLRDADQPVRKVPSRDGYPRCSSRKPSVGWGMKGPAAQRIWHHCAWTISIVHEGTGPQPTTRLCGSPRLPDGVARDRHRTGCTQREAHHPRCAAVNRLANSGGLRFQFGMDGDPVLIDIDESGVGRLNRWLPRRSIP